MAAAAAAAGVPSGPPPMAPHGGDALMSPPSTTLLSDAQSWDSVNLSFNLNGENQTMGPNPTFHQGHNELLDPMQYWDYNLVGFGNASLHINNVC